MPALDCRIIPARSISRCETICASLGFSRNRGRKYWESRIETNHGIGRRTLGKTQPAVYRQRRRLAMVKIYVTDASCTRKIGLKKIALAAALPKFRELRTRRRRQGIALPSEFSVRAARHPLFARLCLVAARRKARTRRGHPAGTTG